MRPGIPNIIKLLDNGHWEVLQSSADAFGEFAAHRRKISPLFVHLLINYSGLPRTHEAWDPGDH
jgi:hypothetical protein